jgi:hypothetical protein
VIFPFDPLKPQDIRLAVRHYVRVCGALVADCPHEDFGAVGQAWGGGLGQFAVENVARWTEIHPVDAIYLLDEQKQPQEAVRSVAVYANVGEERMISFEIWPPQPAPGPGYRCGYREYVGPETVSASIREAVVGQFHDHVSVRVRIQGSNNVGVGKFKAIYRVHWEPANVLHVSSSPSRFPLGSSVQVTVYARDEAGRSVAGDVYIEAQYIGNYVRVAPTNTPFTYTFRRVSDPETGFQQNPEGEVRASGFPRSAIPWSF